MPDNQLSSTDRSDNRFESFGALPTKDNPRGQRPAIDPSRSQSLDAPDLTIRTDQKSPSRSEKIFSMLIRTGVIILLALLLDWLLIRWIS